MSFFASRGVLAALAVLAIFWAGQQSHTRGCAAIGPKGEPIQIVDEDAIIVYDATKKIQHFIRRASFRATSVNFGFLVPTPNVPSLSEVADEAFDLLSDTIAPKVREVAGKLNFTSMCCVFWLSSSPDDAKKSEAKAVRVLDEVKVGGFNAVVLEADDPVALGDWLKANGYPSTPELSGWLGPYLAQKWKITAFKIEKDAKTGLAVVSTKAVKMSFSADRPFFPYREPDANPPADAVNDESKKGSGRAERRVLRVFFLGANRMAGMLGNVPWHAKTVWADALDADMTDRLAKDLDIPRDELAGMPWLTAFEDHASPRPGTAEVFFDPAADRSIVRPPDILMHRPPVVVPIEVVVMVLVLLGVPIYAIFRKRKRT